MTATSDDQKGMISDHGGVPDSEDTHPMLYVPAIRCDRSRREERGTVLNIHNDIPVSDKDDTIF